jgi:hypothetical protein
MKTAIIILLVVLVGGVTFAIWNHGSSHRYISIDDLELKNGETTHINLSDLDASDPLAKLAKDTAKKQAAGLDGSTVTIHSVTAHDRFRDATPQDGHKLIVVDVSFTHYKDGFGLAGVQLIDGEQQEAQSYGGDAYQVYLNADGTLHVDQSGDWLNGTNDTVRLYLVYSAPKSVAKVGLGYWGRIIVDRPYNVEPTRQSSPVQRQ